MRWAGEIVNKTSDSADTRVQLWQLTDEAKSQVKGSEAGTCAHGHSGFSFCKKPRIVNCTVRRTIKMKILHIALLCILIGMFVIQPTVATNGKNEGAMKKTSNRFPKLFKKSKTTKTDSSEQDSNNTGNIKDSNGNENENENGGKMSEENKALTKAYAEYACWRKIKKAVGGVCEEGFSYKMMLVCSANCPLQQPVKCGPVCLTAGRSCIHESAKKITATIILAAKVSGAGMLVEPVAALKNAGSNRNMKPKADDHKGGVVAQDKNGSNRRLGSTDHNALDKRLSRNHTEPDPINSRHLLPAVPSTECVKGLLNAVKKLLEAVEQSRKKGVKSVDGLHADNAGAAAVNEAIQECNGDPDEWGVKLAATLENMVDGMIDVVKGGKSAKQALKEFSVKQLEQFDPTGIVTFGKAFVHEVCEVATVPDTYFNKPIEMDNSIEHLGLQVGGEIAVEEAKWTPH